MLWYWRRTVWNKPTNSFQTLSLKKGNLFYWNIIYCEQYIPSIVNYKRWIWYLVCCYISVGIIGQTTCFPFRYACSQCLLKATFQNFNKSFQYSVLSFSWIISSNLLSNCSWYIKKLTDAVRTMQITTLLLTCIYYLMGIISTLPLNLFLTVPVLKQILIILFDNWDSNGSQSRRRLL